MTDSATDLIVRRTLTVHASQERAFEVFTAGMGTWWPLGDKSIGAAAAETAVLEPRAGGRWYERGIDGSECEWGRVLAFEPPHRVVLDWQISARWQFDPDLHSEVEVRFVAEAEGRTRVELEHRGLLEAYGEDAGQMHAIFDGAGGWPGILGDFAGAAGA